ncbi:SM-20-related protein [Acinetobacter calcoaceticus]|uniref:SM-20-related protein n=1 Tax=Acinetobacter calcoaceticus TaxID=471 RepID=A0A4R1Y6N2_ACICA|nr:SM-20-related protein [Acinetobacter calcoaceticus]
MDAILLPESCHVDQILNDLDQHGFTIIDKVYPPDIHTELRTTCSNNLNYFREAAIQNGVVSHIRSDHILWIKDDSEFAKAHLQLLDAVSICLNQHFYLGIQTVEAHFACYNSGEFYALHRDNPQQKNDRVISSVFYLHQHWQPDWGGQLRLQDKNQLWHTIQPDPNRLVLFQSDLLHEVLEAKQQRLSITAWLRSGTQLW